MTNQQLQDLISTWFDNLEFTEEATEFLTVKVSKENLHDLAEKLKSNPDTNFDYLFCETGMDWKTSLGVIYHLRSTTHGHEMVVKVETTDRDNAAIDTVCDIWRTAELHEREIHDLFGIKFNNHPNMEVLILPPNWNGYPLRKDYVDEVNMIIR
jgi:NADH:ubiquinone oxidoreductase subunit C